ncbi:kinase-like domain-containing protein, partial [Scleroderma citrinum]
IIGIARGLSYLHNHHLGPIVHGDLKGSNVLISDNGHALITDFGYTLLKNSSFKITLSLPCGGTYNWMSPEIVESWEREDECKTTTQSDVWAFGMTALELFTRKIPFDHLKNWQGIRRRILQGPPDRPTDCLTHYRMSDDWWGICLECWTSIPLSRPSISQILNKVEATKVCALVFFGFFFSTGQGHHGCHSTTHPRLQAGNSLLCQS